MKQLPILLLNVAVVLVAIVAYDLVRGDDPDNAPPPDSNVALLDAIETLEARVAAIETAKLAPFEAEGANARLLTRIEELERQAGTTAPEPESLPTGSPPGEQGSTDASPTIRGKPSPEEVENFRKLAAAARQQEREKRIGLRVDAAVKEHRIALTEDQREQLVTAQGKFEPRRNQIWGEAKRNGAAQGGSVDWGVIIAQTNEVIVREFTEQISGFITGNDAVLLAETLNTSGK
jgi:hypothetical protein